MEFMVVIPAFDPHWHGDNVDTDLLDQQHTKTHHDKVQQILMFKSDQQHTDTITEMHNH